MGHKATRTTHNINSTFGPGTANKHIVQRLFKKFCKDVNLEDKKCSGWPLEVDNNWEQLSKPILLQLHEKMLKNSTTILQFFGIWSKLKRWKSSISECLMSWSKIRKLCVLKCHLLLFCEKWTGVHRLWCVMKSGLYTTGNDQLNG